MIPEIAIGSTNPVKVQAVKNAINNEAVRVVSYAASSKVRPQPLSQEETLEGARNRALDCLDKTECPVAVGLEGGVVFLQSRVYVCQWGVIADRKHNTYFTNGPLILLPKEYEKPLLDGEALQDIMHRFTGIEHLGMKEGAIGVLTKNHLNREQVFTQIAKVLIGQYHYYEEGFRIYPR